jgi:hypothetical protein
MTNTTTPLRTDERVDNLAALLLVTDEQLADRDRAEHGLTVESPRVSDLMHRVFGADTPSIENWLTERDDQLVAA